MSDYKNILRNSNKKGYYLTRIGFLLSGWVIDKFPLSSSRAYAQKNS